MISEVRFSYAFHEPATLFNVMRTVHEAGEQFVNETDFCFPFTVVQPDQQSNGFVLTFVFASLPDARLYADTVGASVRGIIDRDNEVFDRENAPQQLNRK